MNRMLILGIAALVAIVGFALWGADNAAYAGHGCGGCHARCHGCDGCHRTRSCHTRCDGCHRILGCHRCSGCHVRCGGCHRCHGCDGVAVVESSGPAYVYEAPVVEERVASLEVAPVYHAVSFRR